MSVVTTIASLYRRARWGVEVASNRVRDGRLPVPSITVSGPPPGLVRRLVTCIACFAVGASISWWYAAGAERARIYRDIAERSSAVKAALAKGGAEVEIADKAALEAIEGQDAKIIQLEKLLANLTGSSEQCLVPVSCLAGGLRNDGS